MHKINFMMNEEEDFRNLCQRGNIESLKNYVTNTPNASLYINQSVGVFGYTAIHEAVSSRNPQALRYLLLHGGNVNALSNATYTPLHIAASIEDVECIKVLLEFGANVFCLDEFGKTPFVTAKLNKRKNAAKILKSAEIKKYSEIGDANVLYDEIRMLQIGKDIEKNCLEEALEIAVSQNNFKCATLLFKHGARNTKEVLQDSLLKLSLSKTAVVLLLCHAAKVGDHDMIWHILYGLKNDDSNHSDTGFEGVDGNACVLKREYLPTQWAMTLTQERLYNLRKATSSIEPEYLHSQLLHIALRHKSHKAVGIILLEFYFDQQCHTANWCGLALTKILPEWIAELSNCEKLLASGNTLIRIPENFATMRNLVDLTLAFNSITHIPKEIFGMPVLVLLSLSNNKIGNLQHVKRWSKSIKVLDLSGNKLKRVPESISQSALEKLNLSDNKLSEVQQCICCLKKLKVLDIGNNRNIKILPPELAKLKLLKYLGMKNLNKVKDPPQKFLSSVEGTLDYLRAKLRKPIPDYTIKLTILGERSTGKTTLMNRLDMDYSFNSEPSSKGVNLRSVTVGKKPPFVFKCMDFNGETDYHTLHQCFLSPNSLYLLVWNVTDGEEGISDMAPWLEIVKTTGSNSNVIVVGTHLDMVSDDEIQNGLEARIKDKVSDLRSTLWTFRKGYYNIIPKNGVLMVSCDSENKLCRASIEKLRQVIYSAAEEMPVPDFAENRTLAGMDRYSVPEQYRIGAKFPSSYSPLADAMERRRAELLAKKKVPVLKKQEFDTIIRENAQKTGDIFYPDDNATRFLNTIGSIEHYRDSNGYLKSLYFLDPSWLYDLMVNIIAFAAKTCNFHRTDLVFRKDIESMLTKTEKGLSREFFPPLFELLQRFKIVFFVDEDRLLIPSLLQSDSVSDETRSLEPERVLIRRHEFSSFPPCFWGRFLSRFLHHIKNVLQGVGLHAQPDIQSQSSNAGQEFNEPTDISYLLGSGRLHLNKESMIIIHPSLFLSICIVKSADNKTGIETKVSRNSLVYHGLCCVVDHLHTLIHEWYPAMDFNNPYLAVPQSCSDGRIARPCVVDVREYILHSLVQDDMVYQNGYVESLPDLCPDVMFMDVPPELHLNPYHLDYNAALLDSRFYQQLIIGNYGETPVAVKMRRPFIEMGPELEDNFYSMRHEIIVTSKIEHPNIIQFIGIALRPRLCLVTEFACQGNLRSFIEEEIDQVERIVIYRISQQIASAMSYLHELGIVHRDVKSSNVLMFSKDSVAEVNVKLAHFGAAEFLSQSGLNKITGTYAFMAPEVGDKKTNLDYNAKVDVFSFAMVLYECLTKRFPFDNMSYILENRHRLIQEGKRPHFFDVESTRFGFLTLTELMLKAWEQEPMKRPTSHEVLHQLSTPCFCLLYGKQHFPRVYKPHELFFLEDKQELWQCSYDIACAAIIVMDMTNGAIKTRISPVLQHMNVNLYTHSLHVVDANHVAMILNTTTNDYVAFYSTMDYSFLGCHEFNEGSHITSLSVIHQYAFIGLNGGYLLKVAKGDFLIGQFTGRQILIRDGHSISVIATFESHLFVSCDENIYEFVLNSEDADGLEMTAEISLTESVSNMVISPDGLLLFISFQDSPVVSCYLIDTMKSLGIISCSDLIRVVFPHRNPHDERVTSFCVHADTLWVGTGTGHVLIYEINSSTAPKFITWLQPYKSEVSCMTVCNSVGPKLASFVVTFGKNANPRCYSNNLEGICELTESFPVDESQKNKPFQRGLDLKTEYLALIWDAVRANVLRKISYPH